MNIGKAVLIYSIIALGIIIIWGQGRGSIPAWADLFLVGFFVVVLYYGLKRLRDTHRLSNELIAGSLGTIVSISLLVFPPSWMFGTL